MALGGVTGVGLAAGNMDREIVLQVVTLTPDTSGDPVPTWAAEETIWAEWVPAGVQEAWKTANRLEGFIDGTLRIYDREPRPTPDRYRVIFDGRTYDIQGVVEIGRGEGLELSVKARSE